MLLLWFDVKMQRVVKTVELSAEMAPPFKALWLEVKLESIKLRTTDSPRTAPPRAPLVLLEKTHLENRRAPVVAIMAPPRYEVDWFAVKVVPVKLASIPSHWIAPPPLPGAQELFE